MGNVLLIGEPLALLIAQETGPLAEVENFTRKLAGAEVNVGIGLTRLGHEAKFVSRLGKDPFGDYITTVLQHEGINTDWVSYDHHYLTGLMLKGKVAEGDPPIQFYCQGSAATKITAEMIDELDLDNIDFIHISGVFPAISQSCRVATKHLMQRARKLGIPISFDPNLRPTLWGDDALMVQWSNDLAAQADIVLPGIEEGQILTGSSEPSKIADFYQTLGAKQVIVKLGADGAYLRDQATSQIIPGFKVTSVVDTVGAGDGFATGVVSGLVEGLSITDAVRRGNAIGAIQIGHISDNEALPTREELCVFTEANS